jgi:hypothetical protein
MSARLPDRYFEELYTTASDPWQLANRWYEQRKYAITMAMLPLPGYRHAYEPGCSVGVLTELLTHRCEHVTSTDVAQAALDAAATRLENAARSDRVTLLRRSLDSPWPTEEFDLVVMSEVAYYLGAPALRSVLDRETRRLRTGTTIVAAHWRHPVEEYPLTGDQANAIIAGTDGLSPLANYVDDDVAIAVLVTGPANSVARSFDVPGAQAGSAGAGADVAGEVG